MGHYSILSEMLILIESGSFPEFRFYITIKCFVRDSTNIKRLSFCPSISPIIIVLYSPI